MKKADAPEYQGLKGKMKWFFEQLGKWSFRACIIFVLHKILDAAWNLGGSILEDFMGYRRLNAAFENNA